MKKYFYIIITILSFAAIANENNPTYIYKPFKENIKISNINIIKTKIDGVCGSIHQTLVSGLPFENLCLSGNNSNIIDNFDRYEWSCNGSANTSTTELGLSDNCYVNREPICNDGFNYISGNCRKDETQPASSNTVYSCPSGRWANGGFCYETKAPIADTQPCPPDNGGAYTYGTHYVNGQPNLCFRHQTRTSETGTTYYNCPSGWTLSGTQCNRTIIESPIGYR